MSLCRRFGKDKRRPRPVTSRHVGLRRPLTGFDAEMRAHAGRFPCRANENPGDCWRARWHLKHQKLKLISSHAIARCFSSFTFYDAKIKLEFDRPAFPSVQSFGMSQPPSHFPSQRQQPSRTTPPGFILPWLINLLPVLNSDGLQIPAASTLPADGKRPSLTIGSPMLPPRGVEPGQCHERRTRCRFPTAMFCEAEAEA